MDHYSFQPPKPPRTPAPQQSSLDSSKFAELDGGTPKKRGRPKKGAEYSNVGNNSNKPRGRGGLLLNPEAASSNYSSVLGGINTLTPNNANTLSNNSSSGLLELIECRHIQFVSVEVYIYIYIYIYIGVQAKSGISGYFAYRMAYS